MSLPSAPIYRYWFVALSQRSKRSHVMQGLILAALLLAIFLPLNGVFEPYTDRAMYLTDVGTGIFFALVLSYSLATGAYTIERTQRALVELRPALSLNDDQFTALRAALAGTNKRAAITLAVASISLGLLHTWFLAGRDFGVFRHMFADGKNFAVIFGTLLTWFVVTHIVSAFVSNAITTAEAWRDHLKVDLLQPQMLTPIGTIALLPALVLMGAQVFYPLISLGGQFNLIAIAPGFLATLGSLIFLFTITSWSAHRKIEAAKVSALDEVNQMIATRRLPSGSPPSPDALRELQTLLSHRSYLQNLSSWPFSNSVLPRLLFYLVLPPLTWLGAALMESGVEQMLGG